MNFPEPGEYAEYYSGYIKLIPKDKSIIDILEEERNDMQRFIKSLTEEKGNYAYAEGKWSIKEVLGHLADVERVMTYRAMCIARGEKQSLPGFEQDDYVKSGEFNKRSLSSLAEELLLLRNSGLVLFKSFTEKDGLRWGKANNYDTTARAFVFIIAGHELHHMKIMRERYL